MNRWLMMVQIPSRFWWGQAVMLKVDLFCSMFTGWTTSSASWGKALQWECLAEPLHQTKMLWIRTHFWEFLRLYWPCSVAQESPTIIPVPGPWTSLSVQGPVKGKVRHGHDCQGLVNDLIKHHPTIGDRYNLKQIFVLVMWNKSPKVGTSIPTPDSSGKSTGNWGHSIQIHPDSRDWPVNSFNFGKTTEELSEPTGTWVVVLPFIDLSLTYGLVNIPFIVDWKIFKV